MAHLSAPLSTGWGSTATIELPQHPGEAERLDECVQEPIHIPGFIQPHGVLLAVDLDSFGILNASSNAGDIFGIDAVTISGSPLEALVGSDGVRRLRDVLDWESFGDNPTPVVVNGTPFDAIVHLSGDTVIVEFEPQGVPDSEHSAPAIYAAIHRLAGARSVDDLHAWAARELRRLTMFDRVVVYRFHPDDHGEVVAEEVADGMEPYLGLHFPASDIPIQARRLYLTKMSRVIVATDVPNAQLVPPSNPQTGEPLDLTRCELRGISPSHLQFMRNMGQASTMSFSLVYNGELMGMITCAHRTAKRIPYVLRQGYEVLANQVALQWGSLAEIDWLTRLHEVRAARIAIGKQVAASSDVVKALVEMPVTILDVVRADSAVVCIDGQSVSVGQAPPVARVHELFGYLRARAHGLPLLTEAFPLDMPTFGSLMPGVGGALMVPFGEGNYIAWFRDEIVRTVGWLGDQSPHNRAGGFEPRDSFSGWKESVSGTALPWDNGEVVEAGELCRELSLGPARAA